MTSSACFNAALISCWRNVLYMVANALCAVYPSPSAMHASVACSCVLSFATGEIHGFFWLNPCRSACKHMQGHNCILLLVCRTLTPFGFQAEERTLWEATDTYINMSPYLQAHKIKKPLLLIHGEDDNNTGAMFTLTSCMLSMLLVIYTYIT